MDRSGKPAGKAAAKTVMKRSKKSKGAVMTRKEFMKAAKAQTVELEVGDEGKSAIKLQPKHFSTGTVGWFQNQKRDIKLKNGKTVHCQVQLQLFVVGSKDWQEQ